MTLLLQVKTAPGKGNLFEGQHLRVNANNVIIRFLRCRMGDEKRIEDDAMNGIRIIIPESRILLLTIVP